MQLPFVSGALFARLVRIASFEGFIPPPLYFNLARYDSSAPVPEFPCRVGSQG